MNRLFALSTATLLGLGALACGDGEPGTEQAPAGEQEEPQPAAEQTSEPTSPDWYDYDEEAGTLTLELVAGQTTDNNSWNFNGFYDGEGEILVPVGTEVTIEFRNEDQNMAHSVGVGERRESYPANFNDPQPVFEGAMSSNPTSLTESTQAGESESITFTAEQAGEYALICYVPGHAATGMYVDFTVTDDGTAGVRE